MLYLRSVNLEHTKSMLDGKIQSGLLLQALQLNPEHNEPRVRCPCDWNPGSHLRSRSIARVSTQMTPVSRWMSKNWRECLTR